MRKSVRPAVRAGSAFERLERTAPEQSPPAADPPAAVPPAIPDPPAAPPPRRRFLGRLARLARPLALPFLNRLQIRMRSAIDASQAAASVGRVESQADRIAARLDAVSARVEIMFAHIEVVLHEALRPEPPEHQASRERLERLELRLEVMQHKLDQLSQSSRLAQQSRMGEMIEAHAATSDSMSQRLDLLLQRNLVPFGDAMAIRTDHGYLLAPAEDMGLALALLETRGSLEPGTAAVLTALAPSGGTIIDVGANVGTLALPAARRVGPAGRVLALEAAPRVADLLARTMAMNGLGWCEVLPLAAGDTDGTLRFNLSAHTTHNSVLPLDDVTETIDIPSRRLDTLVAPGERVDLVKIDVEGAELQVWRGMQRIVGDNPNIALVLEFGPSHLRKSGQDVAAWFAELQSTGLKAWEIDEATATVRPLRKKGLADVYSINILLLRNSPSSRGLTVQ